MEDERVEIKSKIIAKNKHESRSTIAQIMFDLREDLSFKYIAKKNNVSVNTVIDIFDNLISISKVKLSETICIDEFKNLKSTREKYAFLILNPIDKKIIEVLESRLAKDLSKYFSNATYVVDAFHYLRYVEEAFNDVRIRIMNKYESKDPEYKMLKIYWRILSNYSIELKKESCTLLTVQKQINFN